MPHPELIHSRPVWAEISRERLLANWSALRQAARGVEMMAVVKANAYGHDVLACAPLLFKAGAHWLGVTSVAEGAAVRAVCPQAKILIMSGLFDGEAAAVIDLGLTPVVWEPWQLDLLEEAAASRKLAPGSFPVHLEIDTGMSRQGVRFLGAADATALSGLLPRFHTKSPLQLNGVLTHFCAPETMWSLRPNPQVASFAGALQMIVKAGLKPEWVHAGNSSSLVSQADTQELSTLAAQTGARLMLRPGLALYGYLDRLTRDGLSWPGEEPGVLPVLSWKTRVTSLRTLRPGETAGYGYTYTAEATTRVALLPVGYADGLNRLLSNRGHVLLRGQTAPIAGRVSMDQTILDVSEIPNTTVGDEVVILGSQGELSLDAWDLADFAGTIPWETLCAISGRVPRVLV